MTAYTANFRLPYIEEGQPAYGTRAALQEAMEKTDAALTLGGVAPPEAQDLVAVAGRVTQLEEASVTRVIAWATAVQTIPATPNGVPNLPTPVTFGGARGAAGGWAPLNPTHLLAPADGDYDVLALLPWAPDADGMRSLSLRVNGGAWRYFGTHSAVALPYGSEQSGTYPGLQLTAGSFVEIGAMHSATTPVDLAVRGDEVHARVTLTLATPAH